MNKIYKFFWEEVGMNVVGIKAIGSYNQFVFEQFAKGNDLINPKTQKIRTYDERYRDLLNEGKCILNQHYLIFKEGFETIYYNYVCEYVKNRDEEDKKLAILLKDESNLNKIKTYITLFNQGILLKEKIISICGNYFKNENSLIQILKDAN